MVEDRSTWLHRGLAALAVSALGVGVAGSVALTGAAQSTSAEPVASQPSVVPDVVPGVKVPDAFDARASAVSRGNARPPVAGTGAGRVSPDAAQAEAAATAASGSITAAADPEAIENRADALAAASASIEKQDDKLVEKRRKARAKAKAAARAAAKAAASKGCIPVVGGYTIAARFGDVGAWARYHTGFDFSAPIGTRLRAPTAGTVMNAGIGPASGWAGNYVVIKQSDGTEVLMAHMSRVAVQVGEKVSPCDSVGAVGQTGRAFGPHLHFEVYPAGIEPGDVYKAVDPLPWLTKMHIKP
jgi:murein DD-endopeptidase MepM/ murein hydrolase activator NlpD